MAKKKPFSGSHASNAAPVETEAADPVDELLSKVFVPTKDKKSFTNKAFKQVGKRVTNLGTSIGIIDEQSDSESIKNISTVPSPVTFFDESGIRRSDSQFAITHDSLFDPVFPSAAKNQGISTMAPHRRAQSPSKSRLKSRTAPNQFNDAPRAPNRMGYDGEEYIYSPYAPSSPQFSYSPHYGYSSTNPPYVHPGYSEYGHNPGPGGSGYAPRAYSPVSFTSPSQGSTTGSSWGSYINPYGDQETEQLFRRQQEEYLQMKQQLKILQEQQNRLNVQAAQISSGAGAGSGIEANSSPYLSSLRAQDAQLNGSDVTLIDPASSMDKFIVDPHSDHMHSEIPSPLPENVSKFSAKAFIHKLKKRKSAASTLSRAPRVSTPTVTAPLTTSPRPASRQLPSSPRIIELSDSSEDTPTSEPDLHKQPVSDANFSVMDTAKQVGIAGVAAAGPLALYRAISSRGPVYAEWKNWAASWLPGGSGGVEQDGRDRYPVRTPGSIWYEEPEPPLVQPTDPYSSSDDEYAVGNMVDTGYDHDAELEVIRTDSPTQESKYQRRLKNTLRFIKTNKSADATSTAVVKQRMPLFARKSKTSTKIATPKGSNETLGTIVDAGMPGESANAMSEKQANGGGMGQLGSQVATGLRRIPYVGLVLKPIDALRGENTTLQMFIVVVELGIVIWLLYLLSVVIHSFTMVLRALFVPFFIFGKLVGSY